MALRVFSVKLDRVRADIIVNLTYEVERGIRNPNPNPNPTSTPSSLLQPSLESSRRLLVHNNRVPPFVVMLYFLFFFCRWQHRSVRAIRAKGCGDQLRQVGRRAYSPRHRAVLLDADRRDAHEHHRHALIFERQQSFFGGNTLQ